MNVFDAFHGAAGGWSLGLERAGFRTVAGCEIDPWRRAAFARNFPRVRQYADICDVTADRLVRDGVPRIHVLAGSPPCQDASTANAKGKGVDGERTGLFFEFIRLVRELRPDWVGAENVPGLRARGVDRVLAALEREGYAVWPLVVGAWHAGAPHRRNRVWIVAHRAEARRGAGGQPALSAAWDEARLREPQRHGGTHAATDSQGERAEHEPVSAGPGWPDLRDADRGLGRGEIADAEIFGRGQRRTWRSDPGGARQSEQALHDSDSTPLHGPPLARDQSDGDPKRATADAAPKRCGRRDSAGEAAQRERGGESQERTAGLTIGAGLEELGRVANDNGTEQPALERAIAERCGAVAQGWNGGIAGRLRMDDGLPKGVARAALASYGDAVMPQITEAIGRAILELEQRFRMRAA